MPSGMQDILVVEDDGLFKTHDLGLLQEFAQADTTYQDVNEPKLVCAIFPDQYPSHYLVKVPGKMSPMAMGEWLRQQSGFLVEFTVLFLCAYVMGASWISLQTSR